MEVYICLLLFTILQIPIISLTNNKQTMIVLGNKKIAISNFLLIFSFALLIFVASFRANTVGTDTHTYNYWFEQLQNFSFNKINAWTDNSKIEIGLGVLAKIGISIFNSNHGAWLIINILMFYALYHFIAEYSANTAFSSFLFISYSLFNQSFNISGQFLAASILLLALVVLKRKGIRSYLILLVIACFVHKSAILGLLFLPMVKIKKNVTKLSVIIVASSFLASRFAAIIIPYIVSKTVYSHYLIWEVYSESGIGLFMNFLIFVCFIVFYRDMEKIDDNANLWIFASAATLSLNFFIQDLGMISRVMVYFKIILIVSIPALIPAIKEKFSSKILSQFVALGIIFLFVFYYYYSITHSTCFDTIPYIFDWF